MKGNKNHSQTIGFGGLGFGGTGSSLNEYHAFRISPIPKE